MKMEYVDGKLVVDSIIYDPSLSNGVVVQIGDAYFILGNSTEVREEKTKLKPYKKQINPDWQRETLSSGYLIRGLIPRGGYNVTIGRAITDDELEGVRQEYNLQEDDISDVFDDEKGSAYGKDAVVTFKSRQVKVAPGEKALRLEAELRRNGIECCSCSPERINIRVE